MAYMAWLVTSKYERIPATREEYALQVGVASRTLRRWQNKPGFKEAVNELAWNYLAEGLPEVYAAMLRTASAGNVPAMRLVLETLGILDQQSATNNNAINIIINEQRNYLDASVITSEPSKNGTRIVEIQRD